MIRHAVYCKDCFLFLVIGRFRKSLEPYINDFGRESHRKRQKSLKAPGDVMIAFSGGLGSTVLLDLVYKCYFEGRGDLAVESEDGTRGGKDHPRNELAWKKAVVCYINQGALNQVSDIHETPEFGTKA